MTKQIPSDPPSVSILVVGYNSADLIGDCLGSIAHACSRYSYEVLLVDQGDGSTERRVALEYPEVQIVPSQGNLGFAGGNNLLASFATGRNLLLLNPDVQLQEGAVDALMDATQKHSQASAWGGVTLDKAGCPDVGNTVHVPSLLEMTSRLIGRSTAALPQGETFEADERCEALSGGFVLIDRAAWDQAGGLDERYFLYCEEVDLFYRLAQAGHTFMRIGSARAHHDIGHGAVVSPTRLLYRAAGTMQFAALHWSPPRRLAAFLLIWLGALQRYSVGKMLGASRPHYQQMAIAHERLALAPSSWRFGYDPKKGLLAQMAMEKDQRL